MNPLPSATLPDFTQPPSTTRPTGPKAPRYRPMIVNMFRRRWRSGWITVNGPEIDETVAQPEVITVVPLTPEQAPSPDVWLLEGSQCKPKSKPPKLGDR